jgi:signal peptidase II
MGSNFNLIGGIVSFKPHINTDYSWLNSSMKLGISFTVHIIMNITAIILILLAYDFLRSRHALSILEHMVFAMLFSGALCSMIDKVFWGGSLDYIYLKGLFIFDLKDVYISAFEVLFLWCFITNYKNFRDLKFREMMNEFGEFIRKKYLRFFSES